MGVVIRIAAANSCLEDQKKADVICKGKNDEAIINKQIEKLDRGGTIQLLDGDYYIDAFPHEGNSAVYFGYNQGEARVINIIGDTENKSYNTHFGVVIHVTEEALCSIPEGEDARVFYGTGARPDAPGDFYTYTYVNNVNFENFYLYLFNASYPVIGIDCSHFGASEMKQVGIFTEKFFDDRFLHRKPETPCVGCIGIRSCNSSNDEMARVGFVDMDIGGLYIGYEFIGADHMILRNCFAARCCYGFVFNDSHKTISMINCADEGNTHLPLFHGSGQLTAIDFNIERFNADFIPGDPLGDGEAYASEDIPGSWRGFISYTLQGEAFDLHRFWKKGHGIGFQTVNLKHSLVMRPKYPEFLEKYFDCHANCFYTWTGECWVDAMGNVVN